MALTTRVNNLIHYTADVYSALNTLNTYVDAGCKDAHEWGTYEREFDEMRSVLDSFMSVFTKYQATLFGVIVNDEINYASGQSGHSTASEQSSKQFVNQLLNDFIDTYYGCTSAWSEPSNVHTYANFSNCIAQMRTIHDPIARLECFFDAIGNFANIGISFSDNDLVMMHELNHILKALGRPSRRNSIPPSCGTDDDEFTIAPEVMDLIFKSVQALANN